MVFVGLGQIDKFISFCQTFFAGGGDLGRAVVSFELLLPLGQAGHLPDGADRLSDQRSYSSIPRFFLFRIVKNSFSSSSAFQSMVCHSFWCKTVLKFSSSALFF